jgi:hypothetical protein
MIAPTSEPIAARHGRREVGKAESVADPALGCAPEEGGRRGVLGAQTLFEDPNLLLKAVDACLQLQQLGAESTFLGAPYLRVRLKLTITVIAMDTGTPLSRVGL